MADSPSRTVTPSDLSERITSLLEAELGRPAPANAAPLDGHLDSVQILSLVVAIEDHFQICFEPEDEAGISSLDDVVRIVHAKLNASGHPQSNGSRSDGSLTPETLIEGLARSAGLDDPQAGLRFLDQHEQPQWFTWGDIWQASQRAAGTLKAAGIGPGDRVALILPTGPAFVAALFGAQVLGAIPVPLYPPLRLGRLDEYLGRTACMLKAVDARILVTDRRIRRVLGNLARQARPPLGHLVAETLDEGPTEPPVHPKRGEALALIQFSSGTTTDPKPVGLTHHQVLANLQAIVSFLPLDGEVTPAGVSWLPLYHDMGLTGCLLTAAMRPGPLTLLPPELFIARPASWLRAISEYKATISAAPNFAYAFCASRVRDKEIEGCDLRHWRLALCGAETVAAQTLRDFSARFAPWGIDGTACTPVYGLAEATLAVTLSPVDEPFRTLHLDRKALTEGQAKPIDDPSDAAAVEIVSVGSPPPGVSVEIRNQKGRPVPSGEVGLVWVKGPSVMAGYIGRTEQPMVQGWLDTGDLGTLVDDELYITGRAKDLIILRGANHDPAELERAVSSVDGVRDGCVVAAASRGEQGEVLLVLAEVRQPRAGLAEAVRQAACSATGLDPDLVILLDKGSLPRTSSGKLRRGEAIQRWEGGTLIAPAEVTPLRMAGVMARSALGWWASQRPDP